VGGRRRRRVGTWDEDAEGDIELYNVKRNEQQEIRNLKTIAVGRSDTRHHTGAADNWSMRAPVMSKTTKLRNGNMHTIP
jgi:hypothetical protein